MEEIKIPVPYFKQKGKNTCVFACWTMIFNYFGYKVREEDFYRYVEVGSPNKGVPEPEVALCAKRFIEQNNIDDLKVKVYFYGGTIYFSLYREFVDFCERFRYSKKLTINDLISLLKEFIKEYNRKNNIKKEALDIILRQVNVLEELVFSSYCEITYEEKILTEKEIIKYLKRGIPLMTSYWSHMMVIVGYKKNEKEEKIEKILVHDPAEGAYIEMYPLWSPDGAFKPVFLIERE